MGDELEIKLAALRELIDSRCEACRLINEQRFVALEQARKLQAIEYARRLDALNGEAERLRAMQATYISRELYDAEHKVVVKQVNELSLNYGKLVAFLIGSGLFGGVAGAGILKLLGG